MRNRGRVVLGLLLLVACGANLPAETDVTGAAPTIAEAPIPPTSEPRPSTTTAAGELSTTTAPGVDFEISAGELIGPGTFQVDRGTDVEIRVRADVADKIHVHGYDLFFDLEPGVATTVLFLADVPGIFEVELESAHRHLFEIEVSG